MSGVVVGSPAEAVADALIDAWLADDVLASTTGSRIGTVTPATQGWARPYIVAPRREVLKAPGAMGIEAGVVAVFVDFWSEQNSAHEVSVLMSATKRVLSRDRTLMVFPFVMVAGSLVCEEESAFQDFDPELPTARLYHGVQKWVVEVHQP